MWILPTNEAVCLPLQTVQSVYLCKLSVSFHKLSKLTPLAVCLTLQTQQPVSICNLSHFANSAVCLHLQSVSLCKLSSLSPFADTLTVSPFTFSAVCFHFFANSEVSLPLQTVFPFVNSAVRLLLQTLQSVSLHKLYSLSPVGIDTFLTSLLGANCPNMNVEIITINVHGVAFI